MRCIPSSGSTPGGHDLAGIALSFASRWAAVAIYASVAVMWMIPDRRLERTITSTAGISQDRARE